MMQIADRLKSFLLLPICVDKEVSGEANTCYLHILILFCSITVIAMLSLLHLAIGQWCSTC